MVAVACFPLSIKIAQQPYVTGSLGPKALKYESFEGKGSRYVQKGENLLTTPRPIMPQSRVEGGRKSKARSIL